MRRKFLLLFVFVIYSFFSSQAQIGKGSILVGGNTGFVKSTNEFELDYTFFKLFPSIGIALKENLIIGLDGGYGFYKSESSATKGRMYGYGIFIRKYRFLGNGFYLFAQADIEYDYSSEKRNVIINQVPDVYNMQTHSMGIALSPGVSYELTRRFQLELLFADFLFTNYLRSKEESVTSQNLTRPKSRAFSADSNLRLNGINSLELGIRFLINRRS